MLGGHLGRPKGLPKTGGRKKGSVNRATAARAAEIAETGETPLDYMLRIMRDEIMEPERRDKAAIAAAPFVHPRLAPISDTGESGIIVIPLDAIDMEC